MLLNRATADDDNPAVKALLALGIVAIAGVVGYRLSDPMFDAAAADICEAYASSQGWEVTEYDGRLGRNRWRFPSARVFPDYVCVFRDQTGRSIFLDEFDGVMPRTGKSRWLRSGGWIVMIIFPAGAVALSGAMGLLPRRD